MPVHCRFCGSENVRPSFLKINDLGYLVLFLFPVRCRKCRHRSHISVFRIREVRREAQARSLREARAEDAIPMVFFDSPPREDFDRA